MYFDLSTWNTAQFGGDENFIFLSHTRYLNASHCTFLFINAVYQCRGKKERKKKKANIFFLRAKKEFIAFMYFSDLTSVSFHTFTYLAWLETASHSKSQYKFLFCRNKRSVWATVITSRNVLAGGNQVLQDERSPRICWFNTNTTKPWLFLNLVWSISFRMWKT